MDLSTNYMGLKLRTPIVPSASPLSEKLDNLKEMEDAGASAVVFPSLFEEQLIQEQNEIDHHLSHGTESFAEATAFIPESIPFKFGPEQYLENIRKAKEAVKIPIIGSLNGVTPGGWTNFAAMMEQAGADAIELNVYNIPTQLDLPAEVIEGEVVEILKAVKKSVKIPVALKLSAFYSNFANLAKRLETAGADGLVLFNRFYQPDIDLEELEVTSNVLISTPQALRLPLRWVAILHGRIETDLAATSGIQSHRDVIKMLLVGAKVTQVCSVLYKGGIKQIRQLELGLQEWLEEHEYESVKQMQGSMSQKKVADPSAYERAHYMKALTTYNPAF